MVEEKKCSHGWRPCSWCGVYDPDCLACKGKGSYWCGITNCAHASSVKAFEIKVNQDAKQRDSEFWSNILHLESLIDKVGDKIIKSDLLKTTTTIKRLWKNEKE